MSAALCPALPGPAQGIDALFSFPPNPPQVPPLAFISPGSGLPVTCLESKPEEPLQAGQSTGVYCRKSQCSHMWVEGHTLGPLLPIPGVPTLPPN